MHPRVSVAVRKGLHGAAVGGTTLLGLECGGLALVKVRCEVEVLGEVEVVVVDSLVAADCCLLVFPPTFQVWERVGDVQKGGCEDDAIWPFLARYTLPVVRVGG